MYKNFHEFLIIRNVFFSMVKINLKICMTVASLILFNIYKFYLRYFKAFNINNIK